LPPRCRARRYCPPGRDNRVLSPLAASGSAVSRRRGAVLTEIVNPLVFPASALDQLLGALAGRGFRLVGPVVADGAIVYGDITAAADLPAGWADDQGAGHYRLRRRTGGPGLPPGQTPPDGTLFGYAVGPHSWKKYLFPPVTRLLPAEDPPSKPFAFIGVRPCELAAIAIQDRVFLGGAHRDPQYASRREGAFIVAVNCGDPAGTCFCSSMGSGPRAGSGFDIALTELDGDTGPEGTEGGSHRFLAEPGTERGQAVLRAVTTRPATDADLSAARAVTDRARAAMTRAMPEVNLKELLYDNYASPRWDDVASRCLSCGNCTMVCPTCFCFSVADTSGLDGAEPERSRCWDSCFTADHSYLHGGATRASVRSRYRQWATHKLATWQDQFGTAGCVGCGRCITWCPAGIDITEEVAHLDADS
jgi:sulfhydrogenase subunit beta (sulfur reductase)